MCLTLDPFRLLLISLAGWLNQPQPDVLDYLQEENRVLREQIGGRRLRLNDDQRRRLAVRAKKLGRRVLRELATLVTPETLLAWHRKLIARKYLRDENSFMKILSPYARWRNDCILLPIFVVKKEVPNKKQDGPIPDST